MVVVVFRSRLNAGVDEAYAARAAEMLGYAEQMPGFVSIKDYVAADGERLALIEFETLEQVQAWGRHSEHRRAQQQGRDTFFSEYQLQICERVRESAFPARGPAT